MYHSKFEREDIEYIKNIIKGRVRKIYRYFINPNTKRNDYSLLTKLAEYSDVLYYVFSFLNQNDLFNIRLLNKTHLLNSVINKEWQALLTWVNQRAIIDELPVVDVSAATLDEYNTLKIKHDYEKKPYQLIYHDGKREYITLEPIPITNKNLRYYPNAVYIPTRPLKRTVFENKVRLKIKTKFDNFDIDPFPYLHIRIHITVYETRPVKDTTYFVKACSNFKAILITNTFSQT